MIGVTEKGDPAWNLEWVPKLVEVDAAIIITKNIQRIAQQLLQYKRKIILHATCTGYGGTVLEPNVPTVAEQIGAIKELIDEGFNPAQIVLRVDPIIPTPKGLARARAVLETAKDLPIKRVRISFIDMYPHVWERFAAKRLPHPYGGDFAPPQHMVDAAICMLRNFPQYSFEACAEQIDGKLPNLHQTGCVSEEDLKILGVSARLSGAKSGQRRACKCAAEKKELLSFPIKCKHGCLYCYWKW